MIVFGMKRAVARVLLAACAGVFGPFCFAQTEAPPDTFDKRISRLEELWNGQSTDEYYAEALRITKDIGHCRDRTTRVRNATALLETLLSKVSTSPGTETDDLRAMVFLVDGLETDASDSDMEARAKLKLMCRCLAEIRKEIIPGYIPKPAYMNVGPPAGFSRSGLRFAGMDPATIEDPADRAQYIAAKKQNHENGLTNHRQETLRAWEKIVARRVIGEMAWASKGRGDRFPDTLSECVKIAGLTKDEEGQLAEKIREGRNGGQR
jgi:hypothetical protein